MESNTNENINKKKLKITLVAWQQPNRQKIRGTYHQGSMIWYHVSMPFFKLPTQNSDRKCKKSNLTI